MTGKCNDRQGVCVLSRQERVAEEKESGTKRVPGKGNDKQSKRQTRGDDSRQGEC